MKTVKISEVMDSSGVAFGTSGARGLVSAMTDEVCAAYAAAFLAVVKQSFNVTRIALGTDLRPSSPRIAAACAAALHSQGIEVDYCGALPTPALALYAQNQGIPAIVVTGSHIPFDRNGIKFYRPDGEITKADELAIADAVVELNTVSGELPAVNSAALEQFVQRYLDFFPAQHFAGMKLGVYEHSSVARDVLRQILEGLGAEVTSLGRTEEFVPIDTEAVAEIDIQRGKDWATQHHFDAIISTDGDGDRPLISDETGAWLRGDIVGLICARYLKAKKVVVPVSCNTAIELCSAFETVLRTRIGSPYVIAVMQNNMMPPPQPYPVNGGELSNPAIVGFEANGGFLVGSHFARDGRKLEPLPTRDAVLPALAVLAAAREVNGKVSSLMQGLPARYTASDRLQNFPVANSRQLILELTNDPQALQRYLAPGDAKQVDCNTTDGLRISFDNGEIVHLRPSGNAPELRCYCEAASEARAMQLVHTVLARIRD
ncbi:MAG: phosphomannomutase [Gallionella sp.]|nr:phosphomannomutase [Gallionella sp.]